MIQANVFIPDVEKAVEFVKLFQNYPYDADLEVGYITIDTKSIIGVLANGVGKKLILKVYNSDNQAELDEIVKNYLVS